MIGSDQDFEEAVAAAAGVRNAADAALVDLVAAALARRWWEGWRIHTPEQWLMWRTGVSRATARAIVRLARRAAELPTVMAPFRAGGLSLDQASTIARYVPAAYEASVCELAVNATVRQIVAATRQYAFDVDVDEREATGRRGPERSVVRHRRLGPVASVDPPARRRGRGRRGCAAGIT